MRAKLALFFTLIFSTLLIAPTVVSVVDDSINLSFLLNMNEEEEGNSSVQEIKLKITSENENSFLVLSRIQKKKNITKKLQFSGKKSLFLCFINSVIAAVTRNICQARELPRAELS